MSDLVFPDFMVDLQAWLIAHPLLADLSAQRVWFRIPRNPSGSPFLRIYQAGGGPQASEAPIDEPRIVHEVWGLMDSDYTLVRQTAQALKSVYQNANGVLMGTGTVLLNARVTSVADAPDPDTGWPRQTVDVLLGISLP